LTRNERVPWKDVEVELLDSALKGVRERICFW